MNKFLVALLFVSASAFGQFVEDSEVNAGKAFSASTVVNGWANARSFIYLYNPPGSGKTMYVDRMVTAHSYSGGSGCDLRSYNSNIGTFMAHGANKNIGGPDSSAKLYWGNAPGGEIPGRIVYECWQGLRFHDGVYEFKPAFRVPPGSGLLLSSAHDGTTLIGTFEFREY